ncbi:TOMM precursor leader peptide-binding protein [Hamadaea sp. NPDC051192]|uniref:TOMM precursor leader peptide-binding protein n=1 Tax=Hamadaea sp. NPDC051192 TaxID=3154940 RepID=UPI00342342B3
MRNAFDSVAATRPRIRRDVLFTAAYDGVLFHNSSGGFKISAASGYRLATLIVPLLDGRRTVAEICAKLPDPQRAMVGELVGALLQRDFARDVPADEVDPAELLGAAVAKQFASQLGYLDHYASGAPRRFAAFRDSTAAVIGSGPVASTCALSLIRNGMARVALVGDSDGAAEAEAAELSAGGVPAAVVGIHPADGEPTWADLEGIDVVLLADDGSARRAHALLSAGIPAGRTVVPMWMFGSRAIIGPACGAGRTGCWYCAMLRLTSNDSGTAAAEIWRGIAVPATSPAITGPQGPPAAMIGNLLAFEAFRLLTGALPAETDGKVIIQELESLDVVSERLLPHPACVYCIHEPPQLTPVPLDVAPADQDVDAQAAELSARDGLLQPSAGVFQRYQDEEWEQTPVKIGTVRFTDPAGTPRMVSAFDVHHLVGARTRALAAAAVAYADRLTTRSDATPVTGRSLVDGTAVEVPRALVEPFGSANADRHVEPSRAGAGAGFTAAAAIRDALASALAFTALQNAIAGTAPLLVPLDTLGDDAELRFLVKSAANLDVAVQLLDLGSATPGGAYTLLARCTQAHGDGRLWTLATAPSWRDTAVRALCDLVGQVQLRQQAEAASMTGDDPILTDFDADTLVVDGEVPARLDAHGTWQAVLDRLAQTGADAVAVPLGGADLPAGGLVVTRVALVDRVRG